MHLRYSVFMRWCLLCLSLGCRALPVDSGSTHSRGLDPDCYVPGAICTLLGTGEAGRSDDGATLSQSELYLPGDIARGPDGRLVVADTHNHRVVRISKDGRVSTIAGTGAIGDGPEGAATQARLAAPTSVTFDDRGAMWIAAWQNSRLARVDLDTNTLSFPCGTGERGYSGSPEPAISSVLDLPVSVVADSGGRLFFFDQANQLVRVVEDGQLQDFAGRQREHGFSGDGGRAMDAHFHATVGQTAGPANKIDVGAAAVYIADTNNHVIRRIDRETGIIETVAGIHWCAADGVCVGEDVQGGGAGAADEVGLRYPVDVALGPDGALYIADTMNHCVRVVRDGWTETFAGTCGAEGYEGDNGPADSALLSRPEGVMVDGAGHVYIADTYNHVIRVVHPSLSHNGGDIARDLVPRVYRKRHHR